MKPDDGCVTTLESVLGKTDFELENTLGFEGGYLRAGFRLWALADKVEAGEFRWLDKTRFAGGWHVDRSVIFDGQIMLVQRQDELREALDRRFNHDQKKVEGVLNDMAKKDLAALNVRSGPKMIVKVVSLLQGKKTSYPDVLSGNIPQWRLTAKKEFMLMGEFRRRIPPNLKQIAPPSPWG